MNKSLFFIIAMLAIIFVGCDVVFDETATQSDVSVPVQLTESEIAQVEKNLKISWEFIPASVKAACTTFEDWTTVFTYDFDMEDPKKDEIKLLEQWNTKSKRWIGICNSNASTVSAQYDYFMHDSGGFHFLHGLHKEDSNRHHALEPFGINLSTSTNVQSFITGFSGLPGCYPITRKDDNSLYFYHKLTEAGQLEHRKIVDGVDTAQRTFDVTASITHIDKDYVSAYSPTGKFGPQLGGLSLSLLISDYGPQTIFKLDYHNTENDWHEKGWHKKITPSNNYDNDLLSHEPIDCPRIPDPVEETTEDDTDT